MRFQEIQEAVGRITKQNQTADVGPQEIKNQAAKFGNTVDKTVVLLLCLKKQKVLKQMCCLIWV